MTEREEKVIDALEQTIKDAHEAVYALCERHGFATGQVDTLANMIREIDVQIWSLRETLPQAERS